jgi:hemerythrin superfamily protein
MAEQDRAQDATPSPFDGVTDYQTWNHGEQEDLLAQVLVALSANRRSAAERLFGEYHHCLVRHMRIEEVRLYPLVVSLAPEVATDVGDLRREHMLIRALLDDMSAALAAADVNAFRHACAGLKILLRPHEEREERVIYPVLDRALAPEKRAELAQRLAREA